MSMFRETVEKNTEFPKGRLTQFINDRSEYGYSNTTAALQRKYVYPHTLLSSYKRKGKPMVLLKAGDAATFKKLFNFPIKCQTIKLDGHYNPLDTPETICMILSKLTHCIFNKMQLYKNYSSEPHLIDQQSLSKTGWLW